MNFGEIREQVEGVTGATVNAATLAGWINTAQKEVAKRYGKRVRYWYPPAVTTLQLDIGKGDDPIRLNEAINVPAAPATVILGHGGLREVISYGEADHVEIRDITRGEQGTEPLDWPLGTEVRTLPVASKEYDLPADILTMHEIRDENNNEIFNYNVSPDNRITAHTSLLYFIHYTRIPARIDYTDNGAELEVNPIFDEDVVQFCVSRYWQSIAEAIPGEENKANAIMAEFMQSIEQSAKHLKRIPNQQYTIGIELW